MPVGAMGLAHGPSFFLVANRNKGAIIWTVAPGLALLRPALATQGWLVSAGPIKRCCDGSFYAETIPGAWCFGGIGLDLALPGPLKP